MDAYELVYLTCRQVSLMLMNCEGLMDDNKLCFNHTNHLSMNPETAATCTRSYSHFNQAVFAGLAVRVLILQVMVPVVEGLETRQVLSTS